MPDTDLFGDPITSPLPPAQDGKRRKTRPNGYAAPPGTGPKGETCKTCANYCRTGGHSRTYLKCLLVKWRWTNGPGTDIKASSPACHAWKKDKDGSD